MKDQVTPSEIPTNVLQMAEWIRGRFAALNTDAVVRGPHRITDTLWKLFVALPHTRDAFEIADTLQKVEDEWNNNSEHDNLQLIIHPATMLNGQLTA